MIYREIETATDEVLEFIKNAGIDIESTSDVNAFRIRMPDGSIVEMPPDFNVFGDVFEDSCERHQAELAKTKSEVEREVFAELIASCPDEYFTDGVCMTWEELY